MGAKADGTRIVLASKDRDLDVPALADVVSRFHERIARFDRSGHALGKDGARLGFVTRDMVARVRGEVSAAVAAETPAPSRDIPAAARSAVAAAAVATLNGISATRKAAVAATTPTVGPHLLTLAKEVVLPEVASAARRDAARLAATVGAVASEAGKGAAGLARMAASRGAERLSAVRSKMSPLAKFVDGGVFHAVGKADPSLVARAVRVVAAGALLGAVAFGMSGGAEAQALRPMKVQVASPQMSIDDLWGATFGNFPSAPSMPGVKGTARPVPAPVAAPAPVRVAPPTVDPRAPVEPEVLRNASKAPSKAFVDIAVATMGTGTGDYASARKTLGAMQERGEACVKAMGRDGQCRVEADGVTLDYGRGVHVAVLLPMKGISEHRRTVASETVAEGLRISDRDALTIALHEQRNDELRSAVNWEDPDNEDGASAPRR